MKHKVPIAIAASVVAAGLVYLILSHSTQIAARVWHWQHGDWARFGSYEIPVPSGWIVIDQDANHTVVKNTSGQKWGDMSQLSLTTFSASVLPTTPKDLNYWEADRLGRLRQSGVQVIEQKTIASDDETVRCVGGTEIRDVMRAPDNQLISLECLSDGRLSLVFAGNSGDLESFYQIIRGIKKLK